MTTFQLLLLILSASIFYMFFKQLFSGEHPKRGVDFEAKKPDAQIGGVSRPDKIFMQSVVPPNRLQQLLDTADKSVEEGDFSEAEKALQSALIIDENNEEALHKSGYVFAQIDEFERAKACYVQLLEIDESDDTTHAALANTLHKLGDDEGAKKHHERAIELDESYAPHHFNYANTLYDTGRTKEALVGYQRAFELDSSLESAQKMIEKLSE